MGDVDSLARQGEKEIKIIQKKRWFPYDSMRYRGRIVHISCDPDLCSNYNVMGENRHIGHVDIDLSEDSFIVTNGLTGL